MVGRVGARRLHGAAPSPEASGEEGDGCLRRLRPNFEVMIADEIDKFCE